MKSARLVALAGAALAAGGAALLYQIAADRPAPASSAASGGSGSLAGEPGAPGAELARMTGELAALRAHVAGLETHAQVASPTGQRPPSSREQTRQERLAADEQLHASYIAKVEDFYDRDPASPGWSAATTSRVWETIREMDFLRDAARSVECRSHTCRIEVDDDGTGVLHKNLPVFGQQFADVLPVMAGKPVRGGDGRNRMILYLLEMDQRPPVTSVN